MRLPHNSSQSTIAFSITPMIDIVFLLIIFFLVSAYTSQARPSVAVDLPSSAEASNVAKAAVDLVITIQADETLWIEQQQISFEDLDERFATAIQQADAQQKSVQLKLRGDKTVSTGIVKRILQQARQAGISDYAFTVIPAG